MATTQQVTNLKTDLYLNYYNKSDEATAFLTWLQSNTSYTNGVWKFHTTNINTETEQTDSGTGETVFKNIVAGWARSKHRKQDAWNTWLADKLEYTNGRFYLDVDNNDFVQQSIRGRYSRETTLDGQNVYYLEVDCDPIMTGQRIVFDEDFTIYRTVTDNDCRLRLYFLTRRVLTSPLGVHVDCERDSNGKVYSGGSALIYTR